MTDLKESFKRIEKYSTDAECPDEVSQILGVVCEEVESLKRKVMELKK